jgi:hypothetical protein
MSLWGRGFGRPKSKEALERAGKKKMWGSLKLISDSPQYEVHLAMLSQQCAFGGDLAKCTRHGNVDLRT